MKVVVGLGNPGEKYRGTRHNVGFCVVAELARRHAIGGKPKTRFEAEIVETVYCSESVRLVAPQTYMNSSGRTVGRLVDFFDLPLENLLVVCDDLHLETGRLRLRPGGSSGGQKGLLSIIQHLGEESFSRLRIGIGRPPGRMNAADYVLRRFNKTQREEMDTAIVMAADGVERWIADGLSTAMNIVNSPK